MATPDATRKAVDMLTVELQSGCGISGMAAKCCLYALVSGEWLPVRAIAERMQCGRSLAHRTLAALADAGLVLRTDNTASRSNVFSINFAAIPVPGGAVSTRYNTPDQVYRHDTPIPDLGVSREYSHPPNGCIEAIHDPPDSVMRVSSGYTTARSPRALRGGGKGGVRLESQIQPKADHQHHHPELNCIEDDDDESNSANGVSENARSGEEADAQRLNQTIRDCITHVANLPRSAIAPTLVHRVLLQSAQARNAAIEHWPDAPSRVALVEAACGVARSAMKPGSAKPAQVVAFIVRTVCNGLENHELPAVFARDDRSRRQREREDAASEARDAAFDELYGGNP